MYEFHDPMTIMFSYRYKHIKYDFGTRNNHKMNFVVSKKQDLLDIIETVHLGASKGKRQVFSLKDYSIKLLY
jgi:hypothetical protein